MYYVLLHFHCVVLSVVVLVVLKFCTVEHHFNAVVQQLITIQLTETCIHEPKLHHSNGAWCSNDFLAMWSTSQQGTEGLLGQYYSFSSFFFFFFKDIYLLKSCTELHGSNGPQCIKYVCGQPPSRTQKGLLSES